MAEERSIKTKFWSDNFITILDPIKRYLYLYFLTNKHTNISGIYELPMSNIVFETALSEKEINDIIENHFKCKIYYINGWVCVKNFVRNQTINKSVALGIKKILDNDIPLEVLNEIRRRDTECLQGGDSVGTGQTLDIIYNIINKYISDINNNYKYTIMSQKIACLLYDLIKEQNPAWYVKPNWDQWAHDIECIHRLDSRTYEQIEWMVRWCQNDNFWKKNILSPSKLREQFNKLVVQAKSKSKGREIILS